MSELARHRKGESGSAYIIALMVLLVLTILGLALALVTQSGVQVGANERLVNRVFYASDSAIGEATMRALYAGDYRARIVDIPDLGAPSGVNLATRISTSPFVPILDAPCHLCEINQGNDFYTINHAINATSTRIGTTGSDEVPQAEKSLGVMLEIQPLQHNAEAARNLSDEAQLRLIRF
jgi:hypothetical protein